MREQPILSANGCSSLRIAQQAPPHGLNRSCICCWEVNRVVWIYNSLQLSKQMVDFGKWWVAIQHLIQNAPKRPNITGLKGIGRLAAK